MGMLEKLYRLIRDFLFNAPDVSDMNLAEYLITNGVTFQNWIPVSERLPSPNKLVLCWWESGNGEKEHYGFATFQSHGVWYVSNEGMPKVTHWMPLPTPPEGGYNEA